MERTTTAKRLEYLMRTRNLRQVDILELCKPYCLKYNIKLRKNDLSQYVSGKVSPGQDKLTVLGLALNVNEVWLMGYDVPMERDRSISINEFSISEQEKQIIISYRKADDLTQAMVIRTLGMEEKLQNKKEA